MFKQRSLLVFLTLLLTVSPIPIIGSAQTTTSGEAWLTGWSYRKVHNITAGTDALGTNYQFMVEPYFGEGSDTGHDVYLNNKSQPDFDDIRFTSDDGETLLDYWRESYTAYDTAVFWVELQDDVSIAETAQFYIYYGNSVVNTTSNGDETFVLFSDFRRHMDLDTWSRFSAADEYVKAEDIEEVGSIDTIGKAEGFVYDGTYYYISTFSILESEAWLYQLDSDMDIVNSFEITDGTLIHAGGMSLYNGYLYVALAENSATQIYPSKIKMYHAETLTYTNTLVTSASFGNDHWGGVVVVADLNRMYVTNWGVAELYVFDLNGDYITTIETPPNPDVQDFVYIESEKMIYGSKQGGSHNNITVWRPDGNGNSLTYMGEVLTEAGRTSNGFTWFDDYFYSCVAYPDDNGDNYIRKMGGNLNLTITNQMIYNETTIGPNVMLEARVNMGGNQKFNMGFSANYPASGTTIIFHNYEGDCYIYEGNDDDDTGFDLDADTWTTLSMGWVEDFVKSYKNRGSVHITNDADIAGTALYPQITLWGSSDAPIYTQWILIRNWVYDEPDRISWGPQEYIGISDEIYWNIDVIVLFLGLMLIPSSIVYLVKGGKESMSRDKCYSFLVIFFIGIALFLGVIMQ